MAPACTDIQCNCRRLGSHARKTEACICVHCRGDVCLRRGMQEFHCIAKGDAVGCGGVYVDALDIIRRIASGKGAQAHGNVPCVGRNSGDPTVRQFPYFKGRECKRRLKRPVFATIRNSVLSTTVAPVARKARDIESAHEFRVDVCRAGRPAKIAA